MTITYSIDEHSHRFAAWAASTAARASYLCRFSVQQGVKILENSGFNAEFSIKKLPNPKDIDKSHKQWREKIIEVAKQEGLTFTHGVAAKIINCYLKVRFVCAGKSEHKRIKCLHPPIDRVLLNELSIKNVGGFKKKWRQFHDQGWSNFDSDTYQSVIDLARLSLSDQPLWKIEKYWEGHQ